MTSSIKIKGKAIPKEVGDLVLDFFSHSTRDIPWRKQPTPYHVWLSEIMCQQTRIETVIPYYEAFLAKAPDIQALAALPEERLYKLWEGLGYYSRARNLQKAAKIIVSEHQGQFPSRYEEALSLPGIGDYTAGAILSIAFQQKYAAVDGNALRVFSRLLADPSDISLAQTKETYKKMIEVILPSRPGDFNQGIMDIGATLCLPHGKPLCNKCPLSSLCLAHQKGKEEEYPIKGKTIHHGEEDLTVFLVYQQGKILIHRRPEKGLLASLYEFKNVEGHLSLEEAKAIFGSSLAKIKEGERKDFLFTHKTWHMKSFVVEVKEYPLGDQERFVDPLELEKHYSLPSAFSQFLAK